MHARVITHRAREGNLDRVIRVITQSIAPAAHRQPGFLAFVLMSDPDAGTVVSTSYWNTEYLQDQISRLITLLRGTPVIEHYEVASVSWDRLVLKEEQAAEFLKCSPETLRKRAASGEIPAMGSAASIATTYTTSRTTR